MMDQKQALLTSLRFRSPEPRMICAGQGYCYATIHFSPTAGDCNVQASLLSSAIACSICHFGNQGRSISGCLSTFSCNLGEHRSYSIEFVQMWPIQQEMYKASSLPLIGVPYFPVTQSHDIGGTHGQRHSFKVCNAALALAQLHASVRLCPWGQSTAGLRTAVYSLDSHHFRETRDPDPRSCP